MAKYIVKRVLSAIPTLFLVLTIVFFMLHVIGGSPIYSIVDMSDISQEEIDALNEKYGFNRPLYVQYFDYLTGVLTGDWGTSYFDGKDVFENIKPRMEPTLLITVCSTLITVCIGVPIGIAAAVHRNSWLDYVLSSFSMIFLTIPIFWLGVMMVYILAFRLHIFPTQGYHSIAEYGLMEFLVETDAMGEPVLVLSAADGEYADHYRGYAWFCYYNGEPLEAPIGTLPIKDGDSFYFYTDSQY